MTNLIFKYTITLHTGEHKKEQIFVRKEFIAASKDFKQIWKMSTTKLTLNSLYAVIFLIFSKQELKSTCAML